MNANLPDLRSAISAAAVLLWPKQAPGSGWAGNLLPSYYLFMLATAFGGWVPSGLRGRLLLQPPTANALVDG